MTEPLINIEKSKCVLCYVCVRACPVQSIKVTEDGSFPEVVPDRCIGCGSCVNACSPKAISYKHSIDEVKELIAQKEKVVAIVDPAIAAEFPDITDYRKIVAMIRRLGFSYVMESNFAVDIIAAEYKKLFDQNNGKYYITANCPAVVSFVEKYHPYLLENLAPIVSPMIAMAKIVRHLYGKEVKIVFIGPCIATKQEADLFNNEAKVNAVLTFKELRMMFKALRLNERNIEYSNFDEPVGYKGALYPISTGFLDAGEIDQHILSSKVYTVEGKENMLHAIEDFEQSIEKIKCHFNVYYNDGCLMGPGMTPKGSKYKRHAMVRAYALQRIKDLDKKQWELNFKEYSSMLTYSRVFKNDDQRLPLPTDDQIRHLLPKGDEDDRLGGLYCQACGYESCKDLAIAVHQGLATRSMCVKYSAKKSRDYMRDYKISKEQLNKSRMELKEVEANYQHEKKESDDTIKNLTAVLQKLPSAVVMVNEELKIIQCNQEFIDILGNEAKEINEVIPGLIGADIKKLLPYNIHSMMSYVISYDDDLINKDVHIDDQLLIASIFPIKRKKIIGAIFRDMYVPEVRGDEAIKKITEVIDNNLEMVQKIGFILGEEAAETERMLNSIVEAFKRRKK